MRQEWVGKRRTVRANVQLRAEIRLARGPALECTVRDISHTGARLTLLSEAACPDQFELFIPARAEAKSAVVQWRDGLVLGVSFTGMLAERRPAAAAVDLEELSDLAERLAALEKRFDQNRAQEPAPNLSARLEALEERLAHAPERLPAAASREAAALEGAAPSAPNKDGLLDAMVERLAHLEERYAALAQQQAGRPPAPNQAGAGMNQDAASHEAEAIERRVAKLETALADLRGGVRALMVLTAARLKKSAAA